MSATVIIVNWNSGKMLAECLRRLNMQTLQPVKVIVVDNASTDGSLTRAGKPADNVTLLQMDANLGFAAANNRALAQCDTEFVALLNPDAFPEADWLEQLLASAHAHPNAAAFGSRQLCLENPGILDGIGDIYHASGLAWRDRYGERQQKQDLASREIFSPCAAAALYRLRALREAGGFDEDFFCYLEDVDLGFRLRLAGHRAVYVPEAVVHHAGAASAGGQWSDFAVYHGYRNPVWVFVKNMPSPLFWILLPLHIAINLASFPASVFLFPERSRGKLLLKAKKDALKGLPLMWRKRRRIQAGRAASILEIWKVLDKRIRIPFQPHVQKPSSGAVNCAAGNDHDR
ncbi:MAG TPA: glycosyltransferase family 2 protein [Smithellaceae bacterium]|jgi:GT2 family glycosyltransferase|nr:MAG: N-acetylglucosaminyl-diphospho-decaprenol L-rhamnosyltransferase [Deltaproteobacteria bacterium ADurb.Bin022]HOG82082.1 glycosyltransferase family 2 protein [Smithellaceae bacterium]HOQ42329.1 glycosyltransferase family 2 protein [Smithellaceae bacterium]